jgi:ankyrin repeat protein
MSPLHIATHYRFPLISNILLKSRANPTKRDVFGLNCLDYAAYNPKMWEKMGE